MTLSNQQGQAPELKMEMCNTPEEWKAARYYRQKYFFDKQPIDDPYTWTFEHDDHRHFALYQGTEIAEALLDIGFNLLHANLIFATCDVKNAASKRVLEKTDFKLVSRTDIHMKMNVRLSKIGICLH